MSKVNLVSLRFALLRKAIGLKISRHFVIQSEGKQNLIVTRSLSHASCTLQERAGLDTNINVAVLRDAVINVLILST